MENYQDYVLNQDLTEAMMEKLQRDLELYRKIEEHDGDPELAILSSLDDKTEFRGTVLNEATVAKLNRANELLDILGTLDEIEVDKFTEPHPECRAGVAAINITWLCSFKKTVYKAFRELAAISDEMDVLQMENDEGTYTRLVFTFKNLWLEYEEKEISGDMIDYDGGRDVDPEDETELPEFGEYAC